jgi:hypothetical protein
MAKAKKKEEIIKECTFTYEVKDFAYQEGISFEKAKEILERE